MSNSHISGLPLYAAHINGVIPCWNEDSTSYIAEFFIEEIAWILPFVIGENLSCG